MGAALIFSEFCVSIEAVLAVNYPSGLIGVRQSHLAWCDTKFVLRLQYIKTNLFLEVQDNRIGEETTVR